MHAVIENEQDGLDAGRRGCRCSRKEQQWCELRCTRHHPCEPRAKLAWATFLFVTREPAPTLARADTLVTRNS
eukprot:2446533-Prymnesium_polylepis.2